CQILLLISGLSSKYGPERAERGEQALRIAQELGTAALVGKARISLAKTLVFGPDPTAGLPHLREAFTLYTELGDRGHIGLTHNLLAVAHAMGGEYADASREFDAAATAFVDAGDPVNEASVRNNLGLLLTRTGDFEGAERNLLKSLRLTRRLNAAAGILYPLENLARLSYARGELDSATEHWRELLELSQRTGYQGAEVIAHCGLGEVALTRGDAQSAREHERAAQSLLVDKDAWHEGATDFNLLAARLAAEAGEMEGAMALLRAAEEAQAKMDRYLFATVLLQRGALTARRDPATAAPLLTEALEIFRQLGTAPMSQRAEAILSTNRGAQ
ncbi:MAG: tetratricopeptide repeat protein, partial [Longimicrobiales bacterium]